jgi:general nucleoside transport system permease protein
MTWADVAIPARAEGEGATGAGAGSRVADGDGDGDAPDVGRAAAPGAANRWALRLGVPLVAVVAALTVGGVLLRIEGAAPLSVYQTVVREATHGYGPQDTLVAAIPLTLMGVGLALAYRAKVFTIGAEGQYLVGAVASTAVVTAGGVRSLPGIVLIPLGAIVGAAAGAAWSALSGLLLGRFGTAVVISSLLLNYLAAALVAWAVRVGIKDPGSFVDQSRDFGHARLPGLPWPDVHMGLALAVLAVVIGWIALARTRFGFRLDVAGANEEALAAHETRPDRFAVTVLAVSGLLAGLAGFVEVAGVSGRLNSEAGVGYGFTAIVVALLGRLHPAGAAAAAFGLSVLTIGFESAERRFTLPASTVGVIQALIVLFLVVGDALAGRWQRQRQRRGSQDTPGAAA